MQNNIAQLFGIGAMVSLFLIYQQKSRGRLLLCKLSADIFWVAHYLCLGGTAGMIPNAVGIARELVFLQRDRHRVFGLALWPILFIGTGWALGARTFHAWYNLLPIAASTAVTLSLWIRNPRLTKIISAPVSSAFLVYDLLIGSYVGVVNESIAILSISISFIKEKASKGEQSMKNAVFTPDFPTSRTLIETPNTEIANAIAVIGADVSEDVLKKGAAFADEITARFVGDFEKNEAAVKEGRADAVDRMAHVSTFVTVGDTVYMTYYANPKEHSEDPKSQTARLAYAPVNDPQNVTYLNLQAAGDEVDGKLVDMVYDTILMQKDSDTLYLLWTARVEENYYRFFRTFCPSTKVLGEVRVNRFRVGEVTNDFSASGIKAALAENGIPCKTTYSDIGIMQKLSTRVENGKTYYYTGAYSGDFTCVIKSTDLETWEYVSQPDFPNDSQWENATYVLGDKCFYFVRQWDRRKYGFLTVLDLNTGKWEAPVLVEDCQSRGDFIFYEGSLYLFHAPIDREHIGVLHIDTDCIANSRPVLQAHMHTSCFYPFVQYYRDGELAMSYTIDRHHIRLGEFTLKKYLG